MKKTAIALALAGLVAVPTIAAADTTVYGSVRISENYSKTEFNETVIRDDQGRPIGVRNRDDVKGWDVQNNASRLGFKGAEDLGNGLSAIYHYEFGVNPADGVTIGGTNNRLAYAGLKSGWGQLTMGTQWNPYYFAVGGEVDVFNGFYSANGYYAAAGYNELDSTRSGNQILYKSPSFGNFTLHAGILTDLGGNTGVDQYQVAGIYDNGSLFLGAAYRGLDGDSTRQGIEKQAAKDAGLCQGGPAQDFRCFLNTKNVNQYGVQARYQFGFGLGLAGSYQRVKQSDFAKFDTYDLLVSYQFGNNTVRASYFKAKNDDGFEEDNDGWIVGLQHRMSKRTRLWAEYGQTNFDSNSDFEDVLENDPLDKNKNFSLGMLHDF